MPLIKNAKGLRLKNTALFTVGAAFRQTGRWLDVCLKRRRHSGNLAAESTDFFGPCRSRPKANREVGQETRIESRGSILSRSGETAMSDGHRWTFIAPWGWGGTGAGDSLVGWCKVEDGVTPVQSNASSALCPFCSPRCGQDWWAAVGAETLG